MRKFEKELLTRRMFCGLTVLMTAIMLLPLLYIAQFNHMAGDCYWFGFRAYVAWLNTHNIFDVIKAAFSVVSNIYTTWQGTYSSIFMFAITPTIFGEQYSFIVPYMMIGMTFIATFSLFHVIFIKIIKGGYYNYLILASTASIMQVEFMYTPASGLYWYNGAVHYVFMQGFVYLMAATGISYLLSVLQPAREQKKQNLKIFTKLLLTTIFAFIASGANFSTTLLNMEIMVLLLVASIIIQLKYKKRALYFIIPFLAGAIGFLINVLAPGNSVRQAYFEQIGVVKTILRSFTYSFTQAVSWINIFVILIIMALVPIILKLVANTTIKFKYPLLVLVISFCLYASMFAPGFYGLGSEPLSRNQNICKCFLMILLILNEVYCLGWLVKKVKFFNKIVPTHHKNMFYWLIYICVAFMLFIICFAQLDFVTKKATFVSYGAWDVIKTGDGTQYKEEYLSRLYLYKLVDDKIVYVEPYSTQPYPLWINMESEVSNNEEGILSSDMALWYNKEQIIELKKE